MSGWARWDRDHRPQIGIGLPGRKDLLLISRAVNLSSASHHASRKEIELREVSLSE